MAPARHSETTGAVLYRSRTNGLAPDGRPRYGESHAGPEQQTGPRSAAPPEQRILHGASSGTAIAEQPSGGRGQAGFFVDHEHRIGNVRAEAEAALIRDPDVERQREIDLNKAAGFETLTLAAVLAGDRNVADEFASPLDPD